MWNCVNCTVTKGNVSVHVCDGNQWRMFIAFVLYSPDRIQPPIRVCLVMTSYLGKGFEGVSVKNWFIKNTLFKILIAFVYLSCNCICVWTWEACLCVFPCKWECEGLASTHACRGISKFSCILVRTLFTFLVRISLNLPTLSSFERWDLSFDLWRPDLTLYKPQSLFAESWAVMSCDHLLLVS